MRNKKFIIGCIKFTILIFLFLNFSFSQTFFYSKVIPAGEWIHITSTQTATEKITKLTTEVAQNNFNCIIFSIPNYILTKTTTDISLTHAINEAKKYNLKFFVIIDLLKPLPATKKTWLCAKENGEPYKPDCLNCGNPEVQAEIRKLVQNFVSSYKIDGVIFENLSYPSKDTSYDLTSLERFYTRGNPQILEYEDFQREQLNKFISDLYSVIKLIDKNIVVGVMVNNVYKDPFKLKGGYFENYQDYKKWVENNLCDFILLKLKTEDQVNQINEFLKSFNTKTILGFDSIKKQDLEFLLSTGMLGAACFSTTTYKPEASFTFPEIKFKTNIITGIVVDEQNNPLSDVWVTLIYSNGKTLQTLTSYDGVFSFVNISTQPVNLEFNYPYCEKVFISSITIAEDEIKILQPIIINGASVERKKLFVNIINPKNLTVDKSRIHILARTYPENKVSVFTETISTQPKVFPTGLFCVDNIKLKPGDNPVKFIITDKFGKNVSTHSIIITYSTKPAEPQPRQEKEFELILPENDLMLFTGDILELKVKAPQNKNLYSLCFDNQQKIFLEEVEPGVYYKRYIIPENFSSKKTKLKFCYDYTEDKKFFWQKEKIKTKVYETNLYIEVYNLAYPLVAITISSKTALTYGLHYVRLGGPYITELPQGIKLQIIGKQQNKYKIKLSASLSGWVEEKDVSFSKENKILQNYFTTCSVLVGDTSEQILIPWKEQTPFSVSSIVENEKSYLLVDFFNTHLATTWIIQNPSSKVIKDIHLSQLEDGWVRMKVSIKQKQLWGFWYETTTQNLKIYIKSPPNINPENPLKNIKIALEAGHGGENNTGAVGLAGTKEKNLNLTAVEILKQHFEKNGAKVILMRQGDTNPSFDERLKLAYENSADLIISIHTNASSTTDGYLSSDSGPSVFYKHQHCKNFAEKVYAELLKLWNEKGTGLVENFNYAIVRQSRVPAILIEMGYLTHPEDESILLNKKFLTLQAEKIVTATKNFLAGCK